LPEEPAGRLFGQCQWVFCPLSTEPGKEEFVTSFKKDSVVPYYSQLADIFEKEIEDGVHLENDLLPSERTICDEYQISRSTVRQAMQLLKEKGLIKKIKGVGTRVYSRNKPEQDLMGYHDLDLQLSEQGYQASVKILSYETIKAPVRIQTMLGLDADERVVQVIRLRLVDNDPLFLEKIYLPEKRFPFTRAESFEKTNIFLKLIQEDYDYKLGRAQVYLEPVILDEPESELLKPDHKPTPGLLIERVSYTEEGEAICVTKRIFRGDRCRHILHINH